MVLTHPMTGSYSDKTDPVSLASNPIHSTSSSPVEYYIRATLPGLSSLPPSLRTMEQPWQGPNVYAYYADAGRPERQPGPSMEQHSPVASSQRRYPTTSQGAFLPPPPLPGSAPSGNMALPPFSQTFQSGPYHSPPTSATMPPTSQTHIQHQPMAYSPQMAMPPPGYGGNNYYPVTSPMAMSSQALPIGPGSSGGHRAPPPHSYAESPRMVTSYHHPPPGSVRDLTSPTSPTNHFHPGVIPPSAGSSSSSSYPSISKMPGQLPKQKRRTASDTQSNDSWDEDKYELGMDKEDGDQPWGMPQEQYKALNPRDKKQVRNRIGARRFRAKRKEYVVTLEASLRQRDDEIAGLRAQVEGQRAEINDLRHRLGMPGLPPGPPPPPGLGLNVGTKEAWRDKEDRKVDPIN